MAPTEQEAEAMPLEVLIIATKQARLTPGMTALGFVMANGRVSDTPPAPLDQGTA